MFFFSAQSFVPWRKFQDARPAGRVQSFVLAPEHDRVVDRHNWGLFSHQSEYRPPVNRTTPGYAHRTSAVTSCPRV